MLPHTANIYLVILTEAQHQIYWWIGRNNRRTHVRTSSVLPSVSSQPLAEGTSSSKQKGRVFFVVRPAYGNPPYLQGSTTAVATCCASLFSIVHVIVRNTERHVCEHSEVEYPGGDLSSRSADLRKQSTSMPYISYHTKYMCLPTIVAIRECEHYFHGCPSSKSRLWADRSPLDPLSFFGQ